LKLVQCFDISINVDIDNWNIVDVIIDSIIVDVIMILLLLMLILLMLLLIYMIVDGIIDIISIIIIIIIIIIIDVIVDEIRMVEETLNQIVLEKENLARLDSEFASLAAATTQARRRSMS
jgi:hypothetical protein